MKKITFFILSVILIISCQINNNEHRIPIDTNKYSTTQTVEKQSSPNINIPDVFTLSEDVISIGNDYHIETKNQTIGKIEEKIFNIGTTYVLYDKNDVIYCTAKQSVLSLVTEIKIYDYKNQYIGKVKQEIFENLFSMKNTYSIYDMNNDRIGTSRKLDLFSTSIDIYDNNGKILCNIKRPMINLLSDSWEYNIKGDIDRRLLIFIGCYKTNSDNKRKNKD